MKLKECYESYVLGASSINNWRKMDENELINNYIKYEKDNPELAQSYLCAIFVKFWYAINSDYRACKVSGVTIEDCYEWLVRAIMYVLRERIWLNPNSSLYNDPKGPEKAMRIRLASSRKMFYQESNYGCRKANFGVSSIEELTEANKFLPEFSYSDPDFGWVNSSIQELIIKSFAKGDYFLAFMVDGICFYDVFKNVKKKDQKTEEFSKKKLARFMGTLGEIYAKSFSRRFDIKEDSVNAAINTGIKPLSADVIRKRINKNLIKLQNIVKEF